MPIETLKRHWWVPVIRGIVAIIFGVIAFTHAVMAAATLVLFFGAWVVIDVIFRVIGPVGSRVTGLDLGCSRVRGIVRYSLRWLMVLALSVTASSRVISLAAS